MQLICTLMCLSVFCLQEWHDNGLQRNEISSLSVGWTHLLLKTNKLWVSYSDYFRDILSNKPLVINRWTPNSFLSPFYVVKISLSFSINIASDRAGLCVIRFVTKLVILNQFLFVTLQYRSFSFVFQLGMTIDGWCWEENSVIIEIIREPFRSMYTLRNYRESWLPLLDHQVSIFTTVDFWWVKILHLLRKDV